MNQAILSKKLANVIKAVATRPTLPVLSHVLLKVENGQATLAGCDLEMFVIERFEIDSDDFECCPPAKLFTDLVGAFDGDIKLSFKNDNLYLNGKNTKIKTVPASEFPILPELPETEPAKMESSDIIYLISHTVYACSQDQARPTLTGVHFDFGDKVSASSADGIRLAHCEYSIFADLPNVTIPAGFLLNLAVALKDKDVMVNTWTTETQVIFSFDNTVMVSQLIPGNFPSVKQIIPTTHQVSVTLDTEKMRKALKKPLFIATDESHLVEITFNSESVTLFAESPEKGECTEHLECSVIGENYKTACNGAFLLDALSRCGNKTTIEQNGKSSPFVIYTPDKEDTELHIIMPLHLHSN